MVLKADKSEKPWKLAGKADLGWLMGGAYEYAGTCDGAAFLCTYSSSADEGVFTLARPEAASGDRETGGTPKSDPASRTDAATSSPAP